jgi:uncharacterized membrane-anchored protein
MPSSERFIKVPEITVGFWIIKILSTGMGEDASDFLVRQFGKAPAVMTGLLALLVGLYMQFRIRTYNRWIYWFAVAMVSLFGTMAADVLHLGLGIPYLVSTVFFSLVLIAVFWTWYRVEGTLSIKSISTTRREVFYWLTVLTTFALGTAAGDMTARTLKWGYLLSGIIFGVIFFLPGSGYLLFKYDAVLAFWFSYIITRPFGASFADWIGADKYLGGLGYGFGRTSLILAGLIVVMVGLQPKDAKMNIH